MEFVRGIAEDLETKTDIPEVMPYNLILNSGGSRYFQFHGQCQLGSLSQVKFHYLTTRSLISIQIKPDNIPNIFNNLNSKPIEQPPMRFMRT